MPSERAYRVPARTILATIGLTLATVVAVVFVMHVQRVLVWMPSRSSSPSRSTRR
ncbi:hypothetical protein ACFOWZ_07875 [Lentzea rhizosphaerae]|uniref:Uncharacterized protein n=1 Tax=Lentzea rhizosphaerae TaxID=2041025 RepID=A0ABV8BPZ9_9PSEU